MSTSASPDIDLVTADDALRLENQLCFAIYNNANKISRLYRPFLEPFGLTFPQYLALLALFGRPPCTVSDLSRALNLESNTLTPLLKRLEATNYVTRQRDRDDERCVRIALTPKGVAFQAEAAAIRKRLVREVAVSEEDQTFLKATLRHLSHRIDMVTTLGAARNPSSAPPEGHTDDGHEG